MKLRFNEFEIEEINGLIIIKKFHDIIPTDHKEIDDLIELLSIFKSEKLKRELRSLT